MLALAFQAWFVYNYELLYLGNLPIIRLRTDGYRCEVRHS